MKDIYFPDPEVVGYVEDRMDAKWGFPKMGTLIVVVPFMLLVGVSFCYHYYMYRILPYMSSDIELLR